MDNVEEALNDLDQIEFAVVSEPEEITSVWDDIGYITEDRRKQLNLRSNALEAIYELKKYFSGQRTLTSEKVDQLMDPIYKYFLKDDEASFVTQFVLKFRMNYLP